MVTDSWTGPGREGKVEKNHREKRPIAGTQTRRVEEMNSQQIDEAEPISQIKRGHNDRHSQEEDKGIISIYEGTAKGDIGIVHELGNLIARSVEKRSNMKIFSDRCKRAICHELII